MQRFQPNVNAAPHPDPVVSTDQAEQALRESIAETARMMSRAGLAEAFGHVSARSGEGFLITSTLPFTEATADDVISVPNPLAPPTGDPRIPLETPMHAALYVSRPDISAICRGHPPSVVAWGTGTAPLPLLHGLGGLAGEVVAVHPDTTLISSPAQAEAVAGTLSDDSAVILRANGCLAVGASLLEALTRLYYLEERASVALQTQGIPPAVDWEPRLRDTAIELKRAKAWVAATFG